MPSVKDLKKENKELREELAGIKKEFGLDREPSLMDHITNTERLTLEAISSLVRECEEKTGRALDPPNFNMEAYRDLLARRIETEINPPIIMKTCPHEHFCPCEEEEEVRKFSKLAGLRTMVEYLVDKANSPNYNFKNKQAFLDWIRGITNENW